ncbi:unnamed protein product [Hapterophycus canaliculatus]
MLPRGTRSVVVIFCSCVMLPLLSSAFVVVPSSVSASRRALWSRHADAVQLSGTPVVRRARSLPGKRPTGVKVTVLEATTDGSEQLREQQPPETPTEQQREAARGRQLNIACNDVVRTILDGNPSNEKERAEALRERLLAQRDELVSPDDRMSALFFDNLLLVCQHELHPDIGVLRGQYGKAWHTILHYIEDAGWQLTDPPFSISG